MDLDTRELRPSVNIINAVETRKVSKFDNRVEPNRERNKVRDDRDRNRN